MSFYMFFACILSYFIKGVAGFGNTLVFSTIMSFRTNNINISPVELLVSAPSNLLLLWQNRKGLNAKIWMPLVGMVFLGDLPGVFFLKLGSAERIKCFFGFVIVFLAVQMFFAERTHKKQQPNKLVTALFGLVSGLLCGLFGIGALLAAYVGRTAENTEDFKGNLSMVFCCESALRMVLYSATGIITTEIALQALTLLPFMLLGLGLGLLCVKKVPDKIVKYAVIVLLFLSGCSLILTNC